MFKIIIISLFFAVASANSIDLGRIVNGTDAEDGEFPFIVSFRSGQASHKCGGSIISSRIILTAAHCSNSEPGQSIQYGMTTLTRDDKNVVPIIKQIRHEQYNYNTLVNDIALLVLAEDIEFTKYVDKIQLPEFGEEFPDGITAELIGWGINSSYGGILQDRLQKAELLVVNYERCLEIHRTMVTPTNICAGVPDGWKGQCSGDSGGPLVLKQNSRNIIIGIVSWSVKPCTVPPYPGVYTRVASFTDWIDKNAELYL